MVNEWEMANAVREASSALGNIAAETERFVDDKFGGSLFGFGGAWSDACGKRIGALTVATVEEAVAQYLNIYDCNSILEAIANDVCGLIPIIEAAKKELS